MTFGTPEVIKQTSSNGSDGATIHEEYQVPYEDGYDLTTCILACYGIGTPSGLPTYGMVYPDTSIKSYVKTIDFDLEENSDPHNDGVILFKVDYIPFPVEGYDPDPLSRPPDVRWGGSDLTETKVVDYDLNPMVNSATQLYSNLPPQYVLAGECTISFNVADNPGDDVVLYSYTSNASDWHGVPAGHGLFGKWEAQKQFENGVSFWRVTVPARFRGDDKKWRYYPIDSGYIDTDGNQITDDTGQQPSEPVLLDGSGGKLTPGSDPVIFPTDGYKQYAEVEWSGNGVPNPFA